LGSPHEKACGRSDSAINAKTDLPRTSAIVRYCESGIVSHSTDAREMLSKATIVASAAVTKHREMSLIGIGSNVTARAGDRMNVSLNRNYGGESS
jgi:hypothetical protein